VDEAGDGHPVLGLGVVDAVAAQDGCAGERRRLRAPAEDLARTSIGSRFTGKATRLRAKMGRPPMAQTSEKALAAAMRPNQ
jgi:hypothetical protein